MLINQTRLHSPHGAAISKLQADVSKLLAGWSPVAQPNVSFSQPVAQPNVSFSQPVAQPDSIHLQRNTAPPMPALIEYPEDDGYSSMDDDELDHAIAAELTELTDGGN